MDEPTAAERIKHVRTLLDLTQAELAEVLGVTLQTVNRWENGALVPKGDVLQSFVALQPELPIIARVKEELTTVHELIEGVDSKIRGLSSFSFKDAVANRQPFQAIPDHNRLSIAEYRHLREVAYGRLVVVKDMDTGVLRPFRVAWGGRGWPQQSIYSRSAPIVSSLMSAEPGDIVPLVERGRERDVEVIEVSLLERYIGHVLLNNYDNFRLLDFRRPTAKAEAQRIEDLRRAWGLVRDAFLDSLRRRSAEDVVEIAEQPSPEPLSIDSRAALGERFFMQPTKHQEEVMRWPAAGHLLVTGAPGSGKTSVALGRTAMLCMPINEQGDAGFRAETCVGFVLNESLVSYLEALRGGSLGLERMPILAYPQLRQELLSRRGLVGGGVQRDTSKTAEDIDPLIGSLKFSRLLEQEMVPAIARAFRQELIRDPTAAFPDGLPGVTEAHWKVLTQPWADLLKGIEEVLASAEKSRTLSRLVERLDSQRERFARRLESLAPWDSLKFKESRRRVRERVKDWLTGSLNFVKRYFEILGSKQFEDSLRKTITSGDWLASSLKAARKRGEGKKLSASDIDCLLLLAHKAAEGYRGRDGADPIHRLAETPHYSHVFIDEVQDFSAVQISLMAALADPKFKSVTAVGDFLQRLSTGGVSAASETGLELDVDREIYLGVNKRQTRVLHDLVSDYRLRILGDTREVKGELARQGDEAPVVYRIARKAAPQLLERALLKTRENHSDYSIAVLCPDPTRAAELEESLHHGLWSNNLLSCVSNAQDARKLCDAYHVHFTTPRAVKGLEFDAVFIVDLEKYDLENEVDRYALYVALSRPRRRLQVFTSAWPPGDLGTLLKSFEQPVS